MIHDALLNEDCLPPMTMPLSPLSPAVLTGPGGGGEGGDGMPSTPQPSSPRFSFNNLGGLKTPTGQTSRASGKYTPQHAHIAQHGSIYHPLNNSFAARDYRFRTQVSMDV